MLTCLVPVLFTFYIQGVLKLKQNNSGAKGLILSKIYMTNKSTSVFVTYFIHYILTSSSSRWRYSPGWALASATICLQVSRFLALSLHSFIPTFLRSMDTSSSHLVLGLPLHLVACSFPYIFFWDCVVLHSFYMPKPSYSLAFNKPDNVLSLDYGF